MDILITLNSGLGADLGPNFNLTVNDGGTITPNTATRVELIAGKLVSVSDSSTVVYVTSTGVCTNQLIISIGGITSTTTSTTTAAPTTTTTSTSTTTTSTSTTSTTTTLAPVSVTLAYSNIDGPTACYKFTDPSPITSTYYLRPGELLADGYTIYTDTLFTEIAPDGFYSNGVDYWEVNVAASGGVLSNGTPCPQTTTTTTSTSTTSTSTTSTSTTSTSTTSTSTTTTEAPTTTTTTAAPTTTTTAAYTTFSLTYSNTAGQTACTDYATPTNRNPYYAGPGATLTTGTILYTTSALTTPVANGYYSNGVSYWNTAVSAGNLQNETACSTTTTTAAPTTTTTTAAPTTTTSTSTTSTTTTTAAPTTTTTTAAPTGTVDIYITNTSLDVPIGSMTINGVNVDWIGTGPTFVLGSGDNGSFTSNQIGTYDVVIGYGGHIPGQRITFTDSASNITCQNLNGSIGTFTITGATITAGTTITVSAEDGAC